MAGPADVIVTVDEFDRVASKCKWDADNLKMVRSVLIGGNSLSDVAKSFDKTPQYVSTYRRRFLDKVEQDKIERFMQEQRPRAISAALKPYLGAMSTLRDKGYTVDQVVEFLKDNGVDVSASTVRKYLNSEDDRA